MRYLLLSLALLSGCSAIFPTKHMQEMVGHPIQEVLDQDGAPNRTTTAGGTTYYTWTPYTSCEKTYKVDGSGVITGFNWNGAC